MWVIFFFFFPAKDSSHCFEIRGFILPETYFHRISTVFDVFHSAETLIWSAFVVSKPLGRAWRWKKNGLQKRKNLEATVFVTQNSVPTFSKKL